MMYDEIESTYTKLAIILSSISNEVDSLRYKSHNRS